MEEVLTTRLPKGTRRRLERRAKAQKLTNSSPISVLETSTRHVEET
jgi:hypothetical protein